VSILGALARSSRRHSVDELGASELTALFDGSSGWAGPNGVDEKAALSLTAYLRGVSLLSGVLAALPLHVYRKGSRERITQRTVLDSPSPRQTPFEFWQTMWAHAVGNGNAYALIDRNRAGVAVRLRPIHPSRVRPDATEPDTLDDPAMVFHVNMPNGKQVTVPGPDMFRLPFLSIDGLVGYSPLHAARMSLGIGLAAERTAQKFYGNSARLSGVLSTEKPMGTDAARALGEDFRGGYTGVGASGKVPVLHSGLKYTPLSLAPGDAELLVTRKFTVTEVARFLGIPPHLLMDVETSTSWGTGIEEQQIAFHTYTLVPLVRMCEQRVTRQLLPGGWESGIWYAEASVQGLLRGNSSARSQFFHSAIADGWLSRNEVRALENLEPVEGLDEMLVPSNMTLISVDGTIVPLSAKGAA
jgi:HK97 family phage portal protein